jgi:hypothetical protein
VVEKVCYIEHYVITICCSSIIQFSHCDIPIKFCCRRLMADLGFIPLVFWHPSTGLTILERYGPILGTEGGELCPILCSLFCILCSGYD